MEGLGEQLALLRRLIKTDGDPRVRHRADALLLVAEGMPVVRAARLLGTSPYRVRVWRDRFLARGREGLADQPRPGRPPKLDAAARAILAEALERGPEAFGLPVAVWSVRDLHALLARRGIAACPATVHRTIRAMGYRYRRPRHDLKHRQDAEAVAAAERVLNWLKKGAPEGVTGSAWSTSTSAKSIPILGWRRSGNHGGGR
jgi:transposase